MARGSAAVSGAGGHFVGAITNDLLNQVGAWVRAARKESDALTAWFAIDAAMNLLQPEFASFTQAQVNLWNTLFEQRFWLQEFLRGKQLPADWQTQALGFPQRFMQTHPPPVMSQGW